MSRVEALTQQFYNWERRCRGWDIYPFPVELEPPFQPFEFHSVSSDIPESFNDEGLRPTLASSFIRSIKNVFSPKEIQLDETFEDNPPEPEYFDDDDEPQIALGLSLPKDQKIKVEEIEHLLIMLSLADYPISFEIIADFQSIRIQFVCRESDEQDVRSQIKAYYPLAQIEECNLDDIIPDGKSGFFLDFGLKEEFMRPLASAKSFDLDPYIGLFGVLENLRPNEQAVIQILFQGAKYSWSESVLRSVIDNEGGSFFVNAPEMVKLAEDKVSAPLFGVVIRALGLNESGDSNLAFKLSQTIRQISNSPYNELIPLSTNGYEFEDFALDIMNRQSHRQGMLLNSHELANLVHYPSVSVVSQKLKRDSRKTKEAPGIFLGHPLFLGHNYHQGQEKRVTISPEQRLKHMHVIGATGTGKSTLLLSTIIQDIKNGEGIAVIDPHGDLIENILPYIHSSRHQDVIILDPADIEFPVGFNILTAHSEIEKDILSSDLVAVFKRLSTSWGDQMNSVFANAILAFLESEQGGTLVDLRRFLIEKDFRDEFLATVRDPSIVYYWNKEFPILKSSSIGSILTRLDSFLRPKLIRNMVAQKKSFDFESIMDTKKILLVKLSQGLIGAENSYLLGTFIVSKIQQAAMARQAKAKQDRSNFYLYIDEFQNFITPSMAAILSGARKYHLGLILAHQDMQQLTKNDTELASSVVANAGTRICFRVGDTDAKKFEGNFSFFEAYDLQNLDTGEAIIRIERPENDCNLKVIPYGELEPHNAKVNRDMVIEVSRQTYGTPKEEVEAIMSEMHGISGPPANIIEVKARLRDSEPTQSADQIVIKEIPIVPTINSEAKKKETQHRYLQTLIKKMAESRGYQARLEEPTPDGSGRVDVSLEGNDLRIAVEISDTSTDNWEIQNIKKCLSAGYDFVIECSNDTKALERLKKKIDNEFSGKERDRIQVFEPEALFLYLDSQSAKQASSETRVKGYRVKVEYDAISEDEIVRKREAITQSVVRSIRGKKK
ncbi:MAG: type IV secretion system DNA-binding domain-containing protein [Bacteroidota bacterium]